ncbi:MULTISPECIES: exo-alpha-sialidase [unclassified Carboxylicivirga]|uniref:exo-alpha-sialidase n=1 Tax=Carboxylicivirga TaxID=1628153 RepID=UPI003D3316BE
MKTLLLYLCLPLLTLVFTNCSPKVEKSQLVQEKILNYPVLKGKEDNPLLRIAIEGQLQDETKLSAIGIDLGSVSAKQFKNFRVYYTGQDSAFSKAVQYGKSVDPKQQTTIKGQQELQPGLNYFWLAGELMEDANLDAFITVNLDFVEVEAKRLKPIFQEDKPLRMGVAVRQHGDDQVHTYRIPGLATSKQGTLLAIYDVRRESGRDLQGNMDIGLSRSIDGGNTWEPMQIVLDMKTWGGLPEKYNGVSDACILVDQYSDAIYIAGLWMHGVIDSKGQWLEGLNENSNAWNHQWRNKGSQPGIGVKQTSQFLLTKSTDNGLSWSKAVNLTAMCKKPEWWLWAPAPGHGITLQDGTLVFPTQGRDINGHTFSNITYSKNGGETWKTSKAAGTNTTESMAVQLSDGSLMLNMRDNRNRQEKGIKNGRAIATTYDLGENWQVHPTSNGALIESVCMASIHKHEYTDANGQKKSLLLFSNPNSKYQRHKQTLKVSFDDGQTWPEKYWIELDEGSGAGYSCLTSINENTIGILYEGSQAQMTFQRISLSEIMKH